MTKHNIHAGSQESSLARPNLSDLTPCKRRWWSGHIDTCTGESGSLAKLEVPCLRDPGTAAAHKLCRLFGLAGNMAPKKKTGVQNVNIGGAYKLERVTLQTPAPYASACTTILSMVPLALRHKLARVFLRRRCQFCWLQSLMFSR